MIEPTEDEIIGEMIKEEEIKQHFKVIRDRMTSAMESFVHVSKKCESRKERNSCGLQDTPKDPVANSCWFDHCPRIRRIKDKTCPKK